MPNVTSDKLEQVIDAGGQSGVVQEIGVFATILATVDNRKVIVPNSAITGGSIVNATAHPTRRVDLNFPIAPDEDVERAKAVALRTATGEAKVLKDPKPEVVAVALADGLNIRLMAWVATGDLLEMQARLFERVREAFGKEGVRPPIPVREIRMINPKGP